MTSMQEGNRCVGPSYGRASALLCLILLTLPAHSQTVIDGDTLKLNGMTYRLHGIDAPELKQTCDGWPAGALSRTALELMTNGREILCETKSYDRYGRTVAICRADGRDLGAAMVNLGMAWAFTRYSTDYTKQEQFARENGRGVHAHDCQPAWIYRQEKR